MDLSMVELNQMVGHEPFSLIIGRSWTSGWLVHPTTINQ